MDNADFYVRLFLISVPGPSFPREQLVSYGAASSCSMTRGPSGVLSCACVFHLIPVALAVAIESRGSWLKTQGTNPEPHTARPRDLETLKQEQVKAGVFYSRRCSALVGDVLILSFLLPGVKDPAAMETAHNHP